MANNAKGRSEMSFKALGFTLVYSGKDIEHGIEMYEKGGLDGKSVKEYGLEESDKDLWRGRTKVAGKKATLALSVRKGQAQESGHADTGHQQMRDEMEECIGRIEMMVREDRQKQSLKEGKAHTACGAGSNASQKSKGKGMANAFSLLDTGDDGGSEQEDE